MKTHGMPFRPDMVAAIRSGRKTQTRRLMDSRPTQWAEGREIRHIKGNLWGLFTVHGNVAACQSEDVIRCPWQVGDRIFVQEEWADTNGESGPMVSYRSGGDKFLVEDSYPVDYSRYPGGHFAMWCGDLRRGEPGHEWRSAKSMPAWAARTWLEITEIRVQRIQEISEGDSIAEGVREGWNFEPGTFYNNFDKGEIVSFSAASAFRDLWKSLYPGSWGRNEYVWVLDFKLIEGKGGAG